MKTCPNCGAPWYDDCDVFGCWVCGYRYDGTYCAMEGYSLGSFFWIENLNVVKS